MKSPVLTARRLLVLALFALPRVARAEEEEEAPPATYDAYQELHESTCVGPSNGRLAKPDAFEVGDYKYVIDGARATVTRKTKRAHATEVRLGIVSAIKDDAPQTRLNLDDYLAKFRANDVDGIVVGGDTAYDEDEITSILARLAATGLPVYAIIGNQESRSTWNRALRTAHAAARNVLNLDLLRVVDAGPFGLVSLPGYYDKKYTHQQGSCVYKPEQAAEIAELAKTLTGTPIVVSHGPPRQSGKGALDFVPSAGNVGCIDLAAAIAAAKFPVGIFGHVLEAGGHATDLSGKKEVKPNVFADALFLNAGSANSLPWRMNVGPESYGMALLLTLDGRRAKFDVYKSPRRELPAEQTLR